MRVALVSTPFVPVPPPAYGGTELIVAELAEGLREAGHEVVIYGVGGGVGGVTVRGCFRQPAWPPDPYHELEHAAWSIADLIASSRDEERAPVEVIHVHCPTALPLARFVGVPMVYTIHHGRTEALTSYYAMQHGARFVAVSERQRELLPELAERIDVVHHGLDARRYPLGTGGGEALFLGRMAPEKAPHVAIEVARAAGVPLVLAGRPHPGDEGYFEAEVRRRVDQASDVKWIGEVDSERKLPLLRRARALLFPIDWEEPFGLVMVEAMLCGTPVLALARGSVPELIDEGVTGYVCRDAAQMVERLRAVSGPGGADGFDRARCRRRAIERFGRQRMVRRYLEVYRRAVAEQMPAGLSWLRPDEAEGVERP